MSSADQTEHLIVLDTERQACGLSRVLFRDLYGLYDVLGREGSLFSPYLEG
jgi:hypothetical protein